MKQYFLLFSVAMCMLASCIGTKRYIAYVAQAYSSFDTAISMPGKDVQFTYNGLTCRKPGEAGERTVISEPTGKYLIQNTADC